MRFDENLNFVIPTLKLRKSFIEQFVTVYILQIQIR